VGIDHYSPDRTTGAHWTYHQTITASGGNDVGYGWADQDVVGDPDTVTAREWGTMGVGKLRGRVALALAASLCAASCSVIDDQLGGDGGAETTEQTIGNESMEETLAGPEAQDESETCGCCCAGRRPAVDDRRIDFRLSGQPEPPCGVGDQLADRLWRVDQNRHRSRV